MKSYTVIGLSSFGYAIAVELAREGMDVLAIDIDEDRVEKIKNTVSRAAVADATDREALERLGVQDMHGAIVSLGHIEACLLTTMHLKEMKVRKIIVKALSEDHGRILELLGVPEIVFPERDMALRVAWTMTHENVLDHVPLAEGYGIVEISPPSSFLGKTLGELDLRKKYGVQVIVVRELVPRNVVLVPTADYLVKDSDVLVMLGKDSSLKKIQKL